MAVSCIPSLVKDIQLAQKTSFTFLKRRGVERIVLRQNSGVLACYKDQKQSSLFPEQEKGSIAEAYDAGRPRSPLFLINIVNNTKHIGR